MLIERSRSPTDAICALPFLRGLDQYYPDIAEWYCNTVMPGVVTGDDVLLLARDRGVLAGIALGKRAADETKLRCVRVAPAWQNTGAGLRIIERMFEELDTDKPHCTVAEELLHQYSRPFVMRYGFQLSAVDKGRYRRGRLEYGFN